MHYTNKQMFVLCRSIGQVMVFQTSSVKYSIAIASHAHDVFMHYLQILSPHLK